MTQRAILQELVKIRENFGTTILLITHDMAVIAQTVDRVAVMYAGRIVEIGHVHDIFCCPHASLYPTVDQLHSTCYWRASERPSR